MSSSSTQLLAGTASWTDALLVNSNLFYLPLVRSTEERRRFNAEHIKAVKVDSTYYALPAEPSAKLWMERTPAGLIFNLKPYALMMQHPAKVSRLPESLAKCSRSRPADICPFQV